MLRFLKANPSVRVTLVYGLFALTWIGYFSFWLEPNVASPDLYWFLRRYEAIAFAIMTACLFFLLVRSELENRQTIERALRSSEELFATVTRLSPAGIFRTDAAGVCTYVNDAWTTITGAPKGVGVPWIDAIAPDDPETLNLDWESSRAAHTPMRATVLLRRPSFEVRWLQVEIHPEGVHAGAGFVGAIVDITEGKLAEIAMQESEARYRTLIERIPAVTFTARLDEANTIVFISPQVKGTLGFTVEEWTGTPGIWMEHVHPDDSHAVMAHYKDVIQNRTTKAIDYRLLGHAGRTVWVHDAVSPIVIGDRVSKLRGVMMDISERKHFELELSRLNAELERRVGRRTSELEAVVEELRSFSYSVSHDLRAPLRAIQGFGLALDREYRERLDSTGRDYLHRILGSADRMTKLIEDLITLSRVTHAEMRTENLDLSKMAEEVVADLRTAEPLRRVEVKVGQGLSAEGDARLLRVLLENLIGNAWKFTSHNVTAKIEFGALDHRVSKRVFFVRDDGAGFDQEFASKLFVPFQRLHRSTEFPGTGIGLATVSRIIGRHGGRVWAEGREGTGATFYFEL
jgi:PAS domain S-box-containing protein